MTFEIVTIFPRMIDAGLIDGVVGRAVERGLVRVDRKSTRLNSSHT